MKESIKESVKPKPRLVVSEPDEPNKREIQWRRIAVYVVLAVGFFLMGLIPMALKARQYAQQRDETQHEVRLKQMETQLAAAVINADRGDYEPARQTASDFFTSLRGQIDRGQESDLTNLQRDKLKSVLSQRDDVITLLARSDPAAADRLSDIYVTYLRALNEVSSNTYHVPSTDGNEDKIDRLSLK